MVELKDSDMDACFDFEPKPDKGKQIIDAEPIATVATTKLQKAELEDPEEGERLFHSQMWVKGSPVQFIVDSGIQNNRISVEVIKRLKMPTTPPTTIHCRVAPPSARSMCQLAVSFALYHQVVCR